MAQNGTLHKLEPQYYREDMQEYLLKEYGINSKACLWLPENGFRLTFTQFLILYLSAFGTSMILIINLFFVMLYILKIPFIE